MTREEFREEALWNYAQHIKEPTVMVYVSPFEEWLIEKLFIASKYGINPSDPSVAARYTCNNCMIKDDCLYAWDGYNTDGDCLGNK